MARAYKFTLNDMEGTIIKEELQILHFSDNDHEYDIEKMTRERWTDWVFDQVEGGWEQIN